ncbi:MAG TPA: ORF6N domain-containing protein, partial [Planctomycetota bacterium]|nr:ORF6N domain-containing protein [Planctomycetota bacterium]
MRHARRDPDDAEDSSVPPPERIERRILILRREPVLLDEDLARLYRVSTKALVQGVKRNRRRFPADFCFQLSPEEFESLRSQFVTSSG